MIQLSRILLPTDFSEFSAEATRYACALADQFGSELHLLHVLEMIESMAPDFGMGLALPGRIVESKKAVEKALAGVEGVETEWIEPGRLVPDNAREVELPHQMDGRSPLRLPEHLDVLATMNTADRSIALIDAVHEFGPSRG